MASYKFPLGLIENVISSYGVDDGVDDGIFTDLSKALRFFLRKHQPETFKFDPGCIVATIGIMELVKVAPCMTLRRWLRCWPGISVAIGATPRRRMPRRMTATWRAGGGG